MEEGQENKSSTQPLGHNISVMRDFLESSVGFEWPGNLGKCSGNHCDISRDVEGIPLKWKKPISETTNASIDLYEAGPRFSFQKPFVVKTIRGTDTQKARERTAKEVENMKDLRHPHVTALLGTFHFQARLSILIFPAACCDLHQFMKRMSRSLNSDRIISHSDGTSTVDGDTTYSKQLWDSCIDTASRNRQVQPQESHNEPWPLTISIDKKFEMLRSYFVCLLQALSYLHRSGVRHKDIKSANILIDESGSPILTDFGISRRFPKQTSHATNNERKFTRKYASPEIMNDNGTFRDDSSDVFSLGCVFLEMATLLLGETLQSFFDYYARDVNNSGKEEAYYCNLDRVHSWIDYLKASCGFKPLQEHRLLGEISEVQHPPLGPDYYTTAALVDIRQMLDETPSSRPLSEGLWQQFQHISSIRCRDCDPRRPDMWKPSAGQQTDARTGFNHRQSFHAREENNLMGKGLTVDVGLSPALSLATNQQDSWLDRRPLVSLSPTSSIIQTAEIVPVVTKNLTNQASTTIPLASLIHGTPTDVERQNSDVRPNGSLRSSKPKATKLNVFHQRIVQQHQQDEQSRAQRQAYRDELAALELTEYSPSPQTRIIVYDVSETNAFETYFASLRDQKFKQFSLPRFRQKIELGEKTDLIAKVDLRRLKLRTQLRRWMGEFPLIYVLNYDAQPLQTGNRLSPRTLTEKSKPLR